MSRAGWPLAKRVPHEAASRPGRPCELELGAQTDFSEPQMRINTDFLDAATLGWHEAQGWDEFLEYYQVNHAKQTAISQ